MQITDTLSVYPIHTELYQNNRCITQPVAMQPQGIVVHSTAAKGTNHRRWGQGSPWDTAKSSKAAHALIDGEGIWQCLPWEVRCWLAGGGANRNHLQFEICEPSKDTDANAADLYAKTLFLCVHWCRLFAIPSHSVICHAEAHALGLASNHADVEHWWGKPNTPWAPYTMERLRADIARALGEQAQAFAATVRTRTGNGIHLWDSPAKRKSLADIPEGARVRVLRQTLRGWCETVYNENAGFCDGQYLIDRTPEADAQSDTANTGKER